ncbi:hypothetical protein N7486_007770 [Penicillium sp. IBT 16267x]|nr:hypothetical protein N7486_007770 [Penicillium sp. IBT 16267x]
MRPILFWTAALLCQAISSFGKLVAHDKSFHPDHVLRVTAENASVACETRLSVLVNGTSPGPVIHLSPGEITWIRVYNDLEVFNVTIHWHGIAQRVAPFSDGTPQASQWPISPGHFFDYEIQTTPDDAGTYFYHAHVGMEEVTAFGALIVDDCGKPPYDYDEDRFLLWSDYFNKTDHNMTVGLQGVPFSWTGEVNSFLLNGVGVAIGHEPNNTGVCALPIIEVDPGKKYRFRFISSNALSFLMIGFEGHDDMAVIAADSRYTKPAPVDRMQIASGQTFDVLFQAKTTEELLADGKKDYVIQFQTLDRPSTYIGYGVIRYLKTPSPPVAPATPPFNFTNTPPYNWLEYTLEPLYPEQDSYLSLEEVTRRVILNIMQEISPVTGQEIWTFNNFTWIEKDYYSPLLVDIYKYCEAAVPNYDAAVANGGWDSNVRAFAALPGEVLEIVFQIHGSIVNNGGGEDVHPFHAHGIHYYDIGSGPGIYNASANEAKIKSLGWHPALRDTTLSYEYQSVAGAGVPYGWRAWRFRITEPGVWMIHCHRAQHMMMGMQMPWAIGTADQIRTIPLEESQGYLFYGGDVYGNETYTPTYHHHFTPSNQCSPDDEGKGAQRKKATSSKTGKAEGRNQLDE